MASCRCLARHGHELFVYSSAERYAELRGRHVARRTPGSLVFDGGRLPTISAALPGRRRSLPAQVEARPGRSVLFSRRRAAALARARRWLPFTISFRCFIPAECPRLHHYYKRVLPYILREQLRELLRLRSTPSSDLIDRYKLPPERVSVVYYGLRQELFEPEADGKAPRLSRRRSVFSLRRDFRSAKESGDRDSRFRRGPC